MESLFLAPARKENKINGFRKWEQAFRIYATIYCGANPQRAREVWQYISIINTAVSAYISENVYHYNIVFRQLMEFNPARSWAVTYTQMWNLSMKDPLPRNFGKGSFHQGGGSNFKNLGSSHAGGSNNTGNSGNKQGRRKSDYCWSFNKGQKCKFGAKCKFIERCSYCDGSSHGVINCNKLAAKKDNNREGDREAPGASPPVSDRN